MSSAGSPATPTVLVVTDRILYPQGTGNRMRIIELIRGLQATGFRVALIAKRVRGSLSPRIPSIRTTWKTWRLPDEIHWVAAASFEGGSPSAYDWTPFAPAVQQAVARIRPVAVIAQYIWMAPCLQAVPRGTPTFVDTHDLMHARAPLYGGLEAGAWVHCSREEEAALLDVAGAVIAIQRHEQREFRSMVPGKPVICIPHCIATVPRRPRAEPRGEGVAFVGSAIRGNQEGLERFLREAWPHVRAACPAAELRVYGEVAHGLGPSLPGVHGRGFVSDLEGAYAAARVVINPVTLGTGLKIKTVEAMACGKAVVSTACGAAGLEEASGSALVVEDDPHRFAAAVVTLLRDAQARRTLEERARAFVDHHFRPPGVFREFLELLDLGGRASAATPRGADGPPPALARSGRAGAHPATSNRLSMSGLWLGDLAPEKGGKP